MTREPVPQDKFGSIEYGLITPQGELFQCSYAGHYPLAGDLVKQGILDFNNSHGHYGAVHVSGFEFDDIYEGYRVTQAQLDTMFDYAIKHDIKFDSSILRVE